jgi:hypothetical protein
MSLRNKLSPVGAQQLVLFSIGVAAGFRAAASFRRSALDKYCRQIGVVFGPKESGYLLDAAPGSMVHYKIPCKVREGLCISGHDEFKLDATKSVQVLLDDDVNFIAFERTLSGAEILIITETTKVEHCFLSWWRVGRAREFAVAYANRSRRFPRQVT